MFHAMQVFGGLRKIAIAFACVSVMAAGCSPRTFEWAVYYGTSLTPGAFDRYDMVILDPNYPHSLESFKQKDKIVIAYISIGEVMESDPAYQKLKTQNLVINENMHWKGSHTVDIRPLEWEKHLLDEVIPAIVARGYQGLMMDTIDSPIEAERADPKNYTGMKEAAIRLVRDIHARYPLLLLVQNRGYAILPEVAGDLNYLLAESTFTHFDMKEDRPGLRSQPEQQAILATIQQARERSPKLKVLALEYWKPLDAPETEELYKNIRNFGFFPYISTVRLDGLPPEPK